MAKINFTPGALEDMKEIKAYITDELCSEQSAINTIEKIMRRIRQLADFPEIDAPLSSIISLEVPCRFLVCGNYTAFSRWGRRGSHHPCTIRQPELYANTCRKII